jgi:hypothetical protein
MCLINICSNYCSGYQIKVGLNSASEVYTGALGGKVNILGGHSIGHSKQKSVYVHVSYSEMFARESYFTVQ